MPVFGVAGGAVVGDGAVEGDGAFGAGGRVVGVELILAQRCAGLDGVSARWSW